MKDFDVMIRPLIMLLLSSALLAAFCVVSMQYFSFTFDHYFSYTCIGSALFGSSLGIAVLNWRRPEGTASEQIDTSVQWLSMAAYAASGCIFALLYLPIGPAYLYLLLVGTTMLPYMCWMLSAGTLIKAEHRYSWILQGGVLAGIIIGLLLAPQLLNIAGGAIRSGWILCASLGVLALLSSGRQTFAFTLISATVVVGLSLYLVNTTNFSLPHWQPDSPNVIKPILSALTTGKNMSSNPLKWDASVRTDRLENSSKLYDYSWTLINGTAPVTNLANTEKHGLAWWKERFPLLLYPLLVSKPDRMLSVGPLPGAATDLAQTQGVQYIENTEYANAPGVFQPIESDKLFDLVMLSISHPVQGGWVGANSQDEAFLTMEMFRWYWDRLADHGMLSITTRDEATFAKTLVSVWSLLGVTANQSISSLADHLRAYRLNIMAPYKGNFQYLILVNKGRFTEDQLRVLQQLVNETPVEPVIYESHVRSGLFHIFRPFNFISKDDAIEYFENYLSQRFGQYIGMNVSTVSKPGFFHLAKQVHPFLVMLLNFCVAVALYGLLFSHHALRCIDGGNLRYGPAVPVLLIQVLISAILSSVLVMVPLQYTSVALGWSLSEVLIICSMTLLGVTAANLITGLTRTTKQRRYLYDFLLPLCVLLALSYWVLVINSQASVANTSEAILWIKCASILTGWVVYSLHKHVMIGVDKLYPEAIPWSWVISGVGILATTSLMYYFWLSYGLMYILATVAAMYALVMLISLWVRRAIDQQDRPH